MTFRCWVLRCGLLKLLDEMKRSFSTDLKAVSKVDRSS